jgi:hypothetical protein
LVLVHQSRRELVQEIVARIRNTRMQARHLQFRMAAIGTTLLLLRPSPLQQRQPRLISPP